jgi:hypothetical protein
MRHEYVVLFFEKCVTVKHLHKMSNNRQKLQSKDKEFCVKFQCIFFFYYNSHPLLEFRLKFNLNSIIPKT